MKKTFIKSCFILLLNILPYLAHAASWPVFSAPSKEFLLQNYVDSRQCLPGQGKIKSNIVINVNKNVCKTFCPSSWNLIAVSDDECHDLKELEFQGYGFNYQRNDDGTMNFSVISASYGETNSHRSFVKFIMTTVPGEYWQCYEINPEMHLISCANDI